MCNHLDALPGRASDGVLLGGGDMDMGALVRAVDWTATSLGPVAGWPASLCAAVSVCLAARVPMMIWWGSELTMIYNEAYGPLFGPHQHPGALGRRGRDVWPELGPVLEGVLAGGRAVEAADQRILLDRGGHVEECYFTLSHSPIRDDKGGVGGVLTIATETTHGVIAGRRLRLLRELAALLARSSTTDEVGRAAAMAIQPYAPDIPFAAMYEGDRLIQSIGLARPILGAFWPLGRVLVTGVREVLGEPMPFVVMEEGRTRPAMVVVLPLDRPGLDRPGYALVVGVSPQRPLDAEYQQFLDLLAEALARALAQTRSWPFTLTALPRTQQQTERALKASEERFRTIYEQAAVGIEQVALDGIILAVNHTLCRMLGYDSAEIVGRSVETLTHPDDCATERALLERLRRQELTSSSIEKRYLKKSGEPIWVRLTSSLARGPDGESPCRISLVEDISKQKRAEMDLRRARERSEAILASISDGFFVIDREWRYVYANDAAAAQTRRPREEIIGRCVWDVFPDAIGTDIHVKWHRAMHDRVPVAFEYYYPALSAWFESRVYPSPEGLTLFVTEVTERKRAELALAEREAMLRLAQKAGGLAVFDWDLHTRRAQCSEEYFAMFGLAAGDLTMTCEEWAERVHPDDRPRMLAQVRGAVEGSEPCAADFRILGPDGEVRWLSYAGQVFADETGQGARMVGTIADITERKRSEEALRAREERFRTVHELSLDGFVILSPVRDARDRIVDFVYEYANAKALRVLGRAEDELIGQRLLEVVPGHRGEILDMYLHAAETGLSHDAEVQYAEDGYEGWWRIMVVPVGGNIAVFASNITDRKRAEEARHQADAKLRLAMQVAEMGTWEFEAGTLAMRTSASTDLLYGLEPGVLGRTLDDYLARVHPDDRDRLRQATIDAAAEGKSIAIEYRVMGADGTVRWIASRGHLIRGEGGKTVRMMGALFDITERKRAEEALQEADRRKDEFLATLAHELRNPLAPVRNAVQILQLKGPASADLDRARDVIDRQVDHLTRLVDDLLDVSRITRNKIELRRERAALATIVERAVETCLPLITAKRQELAVMMPDEPVWLDADVVRLSQVLSNLLNNAAKYTGPGGHIELAAEREGARILIHVRDNGAGIPEPMLGKVFDLFMQADTSIARTQGGLGIGLTIVKRLVEMHGGAVSAASRGPGQGSQFTISLPAVAGPRAPLAAPGREPAATGRVRVLVVDDNKDSADTLAELLRLLGHEAEIAYDGVWALELARDLRPDLVLLDIGLPGLDGYEIAQRLRQDPETRDVVLAAMTGWGQEEDRRRSRQAGFDHHLVKPVEPRALTALLASMTAPGHAVARNAAARDAMARDAEARQATDRPEGGG